MARALALTASVLAHGAVLLVLAHYLSRTIGPAEPRVMSVSLVPPIPKRAVARPRDPPAAAPVRTEVRPEADATPQAPQVAAPAPVPGGEAAVASGPRLRGVGGCRRPGLTREQRAECETAQWGRPPASNAPQRLELDSAGRYAENPDPVLSRRPKKGCRVRATGDASPMGDSGNAWGGFTCVIPF